MPDDFDDDDWDDEEQPPQVDCACRCGECCQRLIIEVDLEDAAREPKIAQKCSPIFQDAKLTRSGQRELIGYLLNHESNGYACAFLDRETNLCQIHETKPLTCRQFDCDTEGRQKLIELGILPRPEDG